MQQAQGAQPIVIDTNIVLDLLLFEDPTIVPDRKSVV